MRQAGGQLAQGHEFVALLICARNLANAIGQHSHQARPQLGHPAQHLVEFVSVKDRHPAVHHGSRGQRKMCQPRIGEHARDLPGPRGESARRTLALAAARDFAFQDDDHPIRWRALRKKLFAGLQLNHGHLRCQPAQTVVRQISQSGDLPQFGHQSIDGNGSCSAHLRLRQILMH